MYSCDTERFIFCKLCFISFVCLNECCFNGVSLRSVYVTRVWLGPGLGKWMNDHFTTHLLWAVSSGDLISNASIFCHESHHSYLMCNKEQSKEELCLSFIVFCFIFFQTLSFRLEFDHCIWFILHLLEHNNIILT